MDALEEILAQINELSGAALEAIRGAKGGAPGGEQAAAPGPEAPPAE